MRIGDHGIERLRVREVVGGGAAELRCVDQQDCRPRDVQHRALQGRLVGVRLAGAQPRMERRAGHHGGVEPHAETWAMVTANGPPLAGRVAEAVRDAIVGHLDGLPPLLRRSLTWNQGSELAQHAELKPATDIDIWFCDPHSPWQRGTNENTNGLLRQYFPRGTDLARHSRDDLDAVALALNTRPRKTLGWKTPAETLEALLVSTEQAGVATTY